MQGQVGKDGTFLEDWGSLCISEVPDRPPLTF